MAVLPLSLLADSAPVAAESVTVTALLEGAEAGRRLGTISGTRTATWASPERAGATTRVATAGGATNVM